MVSAFQPFVNIGSLIGAVVSNALHENLTKLSYQIQLCILYAVPLYFLLIVWFIPESPRWLAVQQENEHAARSLAMLRPSYTSEEEISDELQVIKDAIQMEKEVATTIAWRDIWRGAELVSEAIDI